MHPALEVLTAFLKLGFTAFGGPAAHIGLFRDEFVRRRKWLTDEAFLDLLGATNLIPGPNSTEMAIHIGFERAGWLGLIAGGLGFIIGDGALQYAPETILEAYYRFQVLSWLQLSVDYQFVANPAYNQSRGPVNVFSFRTHLDF